MTTAAGRQRDGAGTVPGSGPTLLGSGAERPPVRKGHPLHTQPVVRFWHPAMGIGRFTHATILRELAHKPCPPGWAFGMTTEPA